MPTLHIKNATFPVQNAYKLCVCVCVCVCGGGGGGGGGGIFYVRTEWMTHTQGKHVTFVFIFTF